MVTNLGTGGAALDAQSGSTSGADSNDVMHLAHDGTTNYVYLPGGSNSVGCTAPASAASYAAYPLGGGAPTTGAATGGAAFSFSTSGSWERVDLLNGSAAVVASFVAPSSGASTGGTDAYGVTWTITRSTSGRKAVAVVAPVWLLGTDDYFEVADNALLDFGASDSFTVLAVVRQWATPTSFGVVVQKHTVGTGYRLINYSNTLQPYFYIEESVNDPAVVAPSTPSSGQSIVSVGVRDTTADTLRLWANGSAGTAATDDTAASISNSAPLRIGGSSYIDMELLAVAVWRRALTDAEIAAVTTWYANRWP